MAVKEETRPNSVTRGEKSSLGATTNRPGRPACIASRWIIDSGSAFDIVDQGSLTQKERETVRRVADPTTLVTANGAIEADEVLPVRISDLGLKADALVLRDSPSVLSLGKRIMEEGFSFSWSPNSAPVLTSPTGRKIFLDVVHNVPFLPCAAKLSMAAPGADDDHGEDDGAGGNPCRAEHGNQET